MLRLRKLFMVSKVLRSFGYLMIFNAYAATPKITSVLPTTLSCGVDNCLNKTITITGTGFNSDAIVPAMPNYAECGSPITVIGTTKRIVCTIKSQPSAGPLTLNVKNEMEGSISSVTKANFSLSFAAPKVSSVTPKTNNCGVDNCNGKEIKIVGTGFRSDATVPALSDLAVCESPNPEGTEIVCKLNEQTASRSLKVAVKNNSTNQTATVSSANFNISITPLTVRYITPTTVTCGLNDCEGQEIKIVGTSFKDNATVPALDGIAECDSPIQGGASFMNEASIICKLKAQSKDGTYKIAVKTSNITSPTSVSFSIKTTALSLSSVTPASITCGNDDCVGQKIVLKGTGFRSDATVPALTDESVDLASCNERNAAGTEMTCTLKAQNIAKTHTLFVKNVAKDTTSLSSVKLAIGFALPKITSISPSSITCGMNDCDGEKITINGTGFRNDATVPALTGFGSCELLGDAGTKIECTLNAQAASRSFRLAVRNDAKNQTTVVTSDNFSVKVTPFALTSVSPSSVSCGWNQCEGEKIKVIGTGLKSGTVVTALDGIADCDSPNDAGTEIPCTLRAQASSSSNIVNLSNPFKNLRSNKTTPNFQINLKPLPSITNFNFDSRPNCAGYKVTITGTNLGPTPQLINFPGYCQAPTDNGTKMNCFTSKQNSAQAYNVKVYNYNNADSTKHFVSTASKRFTLSNSTSCPSLSISPATTEYYVNQEIPNISPSITGFTPTSFSIHPALPEGLSFNTSTGFISGTPTSPFDVSSFNITASDSSISLNTNINLSVISAPNGVDKIFSTSVAFAFIKNDGTVVTWGAENYGGNSSNVNLTDVKTIFSNDFSFAALKNDGTVVTWGMEEMGGNSSNVNLTDVKTIFSNHYSFAALKNDGTVVTWGGHWAGGDSSSVDLNDIKTIFSSDEAYAALKNDGTVVTWGGHWAGGDSSSVDLNDIKTIFSTNGAFAALKNDGTVVTWGHSDYGGDSSGVDLTDIKTISNTQYAFAALKNDGTVVTWGGSGGDSTNVDLTDVKTIYGTSGAFAALKNDGTVVTWGDSNYGSDSTGLNLTDVKTIFNNFGAFAALKNDGTVVSWGDRVTVPSGVDLNDIKTIFSSLYAFAALKNDGTVVSWGDGDYGGDSTGVNLTDIETISSNFGAFAALKYDGTVVSWGGSFFGGDSSSIQNQ